VAETDLFKWRHYEYEIIILCVRWYLRYALSYRDLEEMMRERGLSIDHTTIYLSPSSQAGLLPPSPLGTDREGFPSISSSLSNAPFRTRFHCPCRLVRTENSILAMKSLFSDDAAPIFSSN
jgi:hypothetical protein